MYLDTHGGHPTWIFEKPCRIGRILRVTFSVPLNYPRGKFQVKKWAYMYGHFLKPTVILYTKYLWKLPVHLILTQYSTPVLRAQFSWSVQYQKMTFVSVGRKVCTSKPVNRLKWFLQSSRTCRPVSASQMRILRSLNAVLTIICVVLSDENFDQVLERHVLAMAAASSARIICKT